MIPNQREKAAFKHLSDELGVEVMPWPKRKIIQAEMLDMILRSGDDTDLAETFDCWHLLIPDGYFIIPAGTRFLEFNECVHTLCMIEVEYTRQMSDDKLASYCELWFAFDDIMTWELQLIVYDRYETWRLVDLCRLWRNGKYRLA